MQFFRYCVSSFDDIIQKEKGKKYKVKDERKKSKLNSKEFIHSLGLWDKYVDFVHKQFNERS